MQVDDLEIGCQLLRRLEGLRLDAYPDPASGGEPWTIGYGNTHLADGSPVLRSSRLPNMAAAETLLRLTTALLHGKLLQMVTVPLEPCQIGALISFIYNVGSSRLGGTHLLRLLNANDKLAAADQLLCWDKVSEHRHLVTDQGLLNRRRLERATFLGQVDMAGSAPTPATLTPNRGMMTPPPHHAAPPAPTVTTADLNDAELTHVSAPAQES